MGNIPRRMLKQRQRHTVRRMLRPEMAMDEMPAALKERQRVEALQRQATTKNWKDAPTPKSNKKKLFVSEAVLQRARDSGKPKQPYNPFQLPKFPPSCTPSKKENPGMALDDAFGDQNTGNDFSWASQAFLAGIGAAYAEGLVFPGYTFLAELGTRAEYRVIAETIAEEMTRKWIKITSVSDDDDEDEENRYGEGEKTFAVNPETKEKLQEGAADFGRTQEEEEKPKGNKLTKTEKIKQLTDTLDKLKIREAFYKIAVTDNLFGRAHLYIDIRDSEQNEGSDTTVIDRTELQTSIGNGRDETSKSKIGLGMFKRVKVVEPVWTYPTNYNASDPLSAQWYEPDMWYVMGRQIHKSRLLKFIGREVPDILKPAYAFGGLSLSQLAKPYVDNWLRIRQSVADLIQAFSIFNLSTDLSEILSESSELLFKRIDLFNELRNNKGLMVTSKDDEEFKNIAAPLGTLDSLQAQAQEHMAAIAKIPIVKLLGIQPAGLNASSEGEIRTFYDHIHAHQEKLFRPGLTVVIDMVQMSLWGEVDDDLRFEFVQLWELDEAALATKRKIDADTGAVLIQEGVISPAEERKRIANDENTPYHSLDVKDLPEPPAQEGGMPGMEGEMPDGEGPEGSPQGPGQGGLGGGNGPDKGPAGQADRGGTEGSGNASRTDDVERGGPGIQGPGNGGVEEDREPAEEDGIKQSDRNRLTAAAAIVRHERRKNAKGGSFVKDTALDASPFENLCRGLSVASFAMALDKQWNEADHPRDETGKFASYGVAPGLQNKAKKLGFVSSAQSSQGKIKLTHANGSVLVVEPPGEKGGESQIYSFYPADGSKPIKAQLTGQSGKSFFEKVGPLLSGMTAPTKKFADMSPAEFEAWEKSGVAPKPEQLSTAAPPGSIQELEEQANAAGGTNVVDWLVDNKNASFVGLLADGSITYKIGKTSINIKEDGSWTMTGSTGNEVKGVGVADMQDKMQKVEDLIDQHDSGLWTDEEFKQKLKAISEGKQETSGEQLVMGDPEAAKKDLAEASEVDAHYLKDFLADVEGELNYNPKFKAVADALGLNAQEIHDLFNDKAKKHGEEAKKKTAKEFAPSFQGEAAAMVDDALSTPGFAPIEATESVAVFQTPEGLLRIAPTGDWKLMKAGKIVKSGGDQVSLNMFINAVGSKAAQEAYMKPQNLDPNAMTNEDFHNLVKPGGFEFMDDWGGGIGYKKGNAKLNIWTSAGPKQGQWKISQAGQKPITGKSLDELKAHFSGGVPDTGKVPAATSMVASLLDNGFTGMGYVAGSGGDVQTFRRGSLEFEVNQKTGMWKTKDGIAGGYTPESLEQYIKGPGKKKIATAKEKPPTVHIADYTSVGDYEKGLKAAGLPDLTPNGKAAIAAYYKKKNEGTDPAVLEQAKKTSEMKTGMYKALEGKGYKNASNPKLEKQGILTFKGSPTGPETEFQIASNGDWFVQTTGFSPKKGSGLENLNAFLAGEKAYNNKWYSGGDLNAWQEEHDNDPEKAKKLAEKKAKEEAEAIETQNKAKLAELKKQEFEKQAAAKLKTMQAEHAKQSAASQKLLNSWAAKQPQPNSKALGAIKSYTASGYGHMNDSLRHGDIDLGKSGPNRDLHTWINSCSFPEDMTLYRTVGSDFAKMMLAAIPEGGVFHDKGFSSITADPNFLWGYQKGSKQSIRLQIKVRKGQKLGVVSTMSSSGKQEAEVLANAGATYKVIKQHGNYWEVELLDENYWDTH